MTEAIENSGLSNSDWIDGAGPGPCREIDDHNEDLYGPSRDISHMRKRSRWVQVRLCPIIKHPFPNRSSFTSIHFTNQLRQFQFFHKLCTSVLFVDYPRRCIDIFEGYSKSTVNLYVRKDINPFQNLHMLTWHFDWNQHQLIRDNSRHKLDSVNAKNPEFYSYRANVHFKHDQSRHTLR